MLLKLDFLKLIYLKQENNMEDCPFCNLYKDGERVIVSNSHAWVFPTNIPIVSGHILISPIRHVAKFEDLDPEEVNAIFDLYKKSKNALVKSFGAEGFNVAWNESKVAGQSVPHFHMHLLPRKDGDTGILEYEPRKFLYRTGERETTPEEELFEIVELIKRNI